MKPKIIVIEDEAILRMDLKEMLTDADYDVIAEGDNGEKAIELAHQLQPDLMIMDIKMPKMDGLKASRIIAKQSKTPILMLTAFSQKEFVEDAKKANVLGYLVKPISEANLIPAVEIALSQAQQRVQYEDELLQKDKKMNARKQIERAKGVLMKVKKLNEQAAYEKMRKFSMKQQVSLERTAHAILKKYTNDM
ncbi:ANTAR domain-containing response regulator [Fictibacillus sp. BK138]|uniref:ANTAR domain-containing response regulator n=1 Tax=Fictibacillus sp. BK138 TaxID=2512121 RepID=UPI0010299F81|nr:response regulator [Fictibacillus sp. BK138]RZT21429.1 response regulator receiver and ANTAR domain protein [Fictibacillus sp. BK138]